MFQIGICSMSRWEGGLLLFSILSCYYSVYYHVIIQYTIMLLFSILSCYYSVYYHVISMYKRSVYIHRLLMKVMFTLIQGLLTSYKWVQMDMSFLWYASSWYNCSSSTISPYLKINIKHTPFASLPIK